MEEGRLEALEKRRVRWIGIPEQHRRDEHDPRQEDREDEGVGHPPPKPPIQNKTECVNRHGLIF
jgi:hypothetical protein